MASPTYKAADFIAAIPGSAGIISTIAQRVGCEWHTAKKYITEYPTVAAVYQDECERVLDMSETAVLKDILAGEVTTAKWYLTMKGRQRGYARTERQEVTGVDLKQLTTAQLERLANGEELYAVLADPRASGT